MEIEKTPDYKNIVYPQEVVCRNTVEITTKPSKDFYNFNTFETTRKGVKTIGKRDLYSYKSKIHQLLNTIHEWTQPEDTPHIAAFYQNLVLQDISLARQHMYLERLKRLSRFRKPITQYTPDDVRKLVFLFKQTNTAPATIELYLQTIKKLFTTFNQKPPVENITIHTTQIYPKNLLTEEDIIKLTTTAKYSRDKALIQTLWETGARIGEILNLTIADIDFTNHRTQLDGKTGQRTIPVYACLPWIHNYLKKHNLTNKDYLFTEIGKTTPVTYDNVRITLQRIAKSAGINKPTNPHHFRHSRATQLATIMTEPMLRKYFGWTPNSTTPSRYVHLSGKDLENTILILNGAKPQTQNTSKLAPQQCTCGNLNTYEAENCTNCQKALRICTISTETMG